MSNPQDRLISQNSVADQIKLLMTNHPESLDSIKYGEIVIKVRDGRIVHMNVNHAFKLDDMGDSNGNDQTKQGDSDSRSS